jgi:pimeloyl-ACP methyl ester carboxylesterase
MKKIEANGISLAVYEWSSEGEPVIFLHFLNGTAMIWNGVVPYFAEKYRTIGIDLRGHGRSDMPESGYELETLADDVVGVMDALGIDRAHFVGSSLGCNIGVQLAAKYPERVRSLALSDGALNDMSEAAGEKITLEYVLSLYDGGPEPEYESVDEFLAGAPSRYGAAWNPLRERAMRDGFAPAMYEGPSGKLRVPPSKDARNGILSGLYVIRHEELYKQVTCPVLFLPAAIHRFFDYKNEYVARIREGLPAYTKSVIIPGTQHVMLYDFQEELSREILTFYEEIGE